MIEEKLKQLSKVKDLELQQELQDMFRIAWDAIDKTHVEDGLAIYSRISSLPLTIAKSAWYYQRFLDKVEQHTIPQIPEKEKLEYLYSFNMSMGHTLKCLIDLTLLSKLNNQDIHNGFVKLCRDRNIESLVSSQQIDTLMSFARYVNIQQQVYNNPDVHLRPIVHFQAQKDFDLPVDEPFLHAGKIVNQSYLTVYNQHIVNILMCIYELHRSLIVDEIKLDREMYSEKVLQLWVNVLAMFDGLGHDWNSIQRIYAVATENND